MPLVPLARRASRYTKACGKSDRTVPPPLDEDPNAAASRRPTPLGQLLARRSESSRSRPHRSWSSHRPRVVRMSLRQTRVVSSSNNNAWATCWQLHPSSTCDLVWRGSQTESRAHQNPPKPKTQEFSPGFSMSRGIDGCRAPLLRRMTNGRGWSRVAPRVEVKVQACRPQRRLAVFIFVLFRGPPCLFHVCNDI